MPCGLRAGAEIRTKDTVGPPHLIVNRRAQLNTFPDLARTVLSFPDELSDLIQFDPGSLSVTARESKHREFKQTFVPNDFSDYTKTIVAFGNADGGFILFGISDKPRQIVGTSEIPDEAQWADRLRDDFDPEISIATKIYAVGALHVYVVGTGPVTYRPVVCKRSRSKRVAGRDGKPRDIEVIREGAIYYRYSAQTRFIGYPELMALIAEREARRVKSFMDTLNIIQKVGVDKAGILKMSEDTSTIVMTPETAKGLSLIDKGRLVEEPGAPAYVVMGNVNVKNVIHAPLDEADKNLPTEAAARIRPLVHRIYDRQTKITAAQVSMVLKHLGLSDDNIHVVKEPKFHRKFITRAGIKAVEEFIERDPRGALRSFGSRAALARYDGRVSDKKLQE